MKIKIGLLALLMGTMLVGCSEPSVEKENITNVSTQETSSEEVENNDEKNNENIDETINNEEKEDSKAEDNIDKENINNEEPKEEANKEMDFKLYTFDVDDTDKKIVLQDIHNIYEGEKVENQVNALLSTLQKDYFKDDNAKIELVSIKDGIATINLVGEDAWRQHFQGSTGGYINQKTIVETILQRDYEGEWLKGVDVLIDGEKKEVYDHASFIETFYR